MIPVNLPTISEESKKYVNIALDTGWISSAGPYVEEFETKFASYIGVKHAVTVSNGTAALHVALVLAGVAPGDEVLTQPLTFVATANAIAHQGVLDKGVNFIQKPFSLHELAKKVKEVFDNP